MYFCFCIKRKDEETLATLAKFAAMLLVQEKQIDAIYTANELANSAMLAINKKLGFEVEGVQTTYQRVR